MELRFISSEVLLPFELDKHYGTFVYLVDDNNGYKRGLYFGGIQGWERLSIDEAQKESVDVPISSLLSYVYNGSNQTYFPDNWDKISEYCTISDNICKNAGLYSVKIELNDYNSYKWGISSVDSDSDNFEFDKTTNSIYWIINPYTILSDEISANLSDSEITYGDEEPYVSSVICNCYYNENGEKITKALVENTDFEVIKPDDFNAGVKTFGISLIGDFGNNYILEEPISLDVNINRKSVEQPTGLDTQIVTYNFDDVVTYTPQPLNWDDIYEDVVSTPLHDTPSSVSDAGTYTYTLSLRDKDNYCWESTGETDASSYFSNLDFEEGDLSGWSLDQNWYTQRVSDVSSWADPNVYEGTCTLELWNETSEGGSIISQSATVPNGAYNISVRAKAEHGDFYLFANDDKTVISIDNPATWTVTTNVTDGKLRFGIGAEQSDTQKYIYADMFSVIAKDDTSEKTLTFTINKQTIDVPDWSDVEVSYVYNSLYSDDSLKPRPNNIDDIEKYINIVDEDSTKVGNYNVTISLKDKNNLVWDDGTSDDIVFSFVITPKSIEVPTDRTSTHTYDGNEYTWLPLNWGFISKYCDITNNVQTNAGIYESIVSLKDKENYVWKTGDTNDITKLWKLEQNTDVVVSLEANGTDLEESSDEGIDYVMSYNPTIQPILSVKTSDGVELTSDDYDVTYPTSYNAGNVTYTVSCKGNYSGDYSIVLNILKVDGYFTTEPTISGDVRFGETLTVNAVPVVGTPIYTWYISDTEYTTPSEGGTELTDCVLSTLELTKDYIGKYLRVKLHIPESENYNEFNGYVVALDSVGKKIVEFKFDSTSGESMLTDNTYTLPGTSMPDDCDGTISYVSSDESIATIEEGTNVVTFKKAGSVTITASISGSSYYYYLPDFDGFDLTITDETIYYYGMADANLVSDFVTDGKFTMPDGCKLTTESPFTITKSIYDDTLGYDGAYSWYIFVPKDTTITSFVESGFTYYDTSSYKMTYSYTDKYGKEYDVYIQTYKTQLSTSWNLIVNI